MTSLYPQDKDTFRPVVNGFEEMIAHTLQDYFDVIVAIETELGVNPSGDLGSIYARLFGTGNISDTSGVWNYIWRTQQTFSVIQTFGVATEAGRRFNYSKTWSESQRTEFGENAPAPFVQLRWQLDSNGTGTVNGFSSRTAQPWRTCFARVDPENQEVGVIGYTGEGYPCDGASNTVGATLNILFWNLFCSGNVIDPTSTRE